MIRIFLLIFAASLMAFDAKILNLSDNKTHVILNRGIQDGIKKMHVAKFTLNGEYLAHGVCLFPFYDKSEWVIFKSYTPQLITKNLKLHGHLIPKGDKIYIFKNLKRAKKYSLTKQLYLDKKELVRKKLQEKIIVRKIRHINSTLIPNMDFTLGVSPISYSSPYRNKVVHLQSTLQNVDRSLHKFNGKVDYHSSRQFELSSNQHYRSKEADARFSYARKDTWNEYSYLAKASARRRKSGNYYLINKRLRAGPIGILSDKEPRTGYLRYLMYSYLIYLESYSRSQDKNSKTNFHSETFLRHEFGFSFHIRLALNLLWKNSIYYRPKQSTGLTPEWNMGETEYFSNLQFVDTENFSIHYNSTWSHDPSRTLSLHQSSTEWRHSLLVNIKSTWVNRLF